MNKQEFIEFRDKILALISKLKEEYNKTVQEREYWKQIALQLQEKISQLEKENNQLKKASELLATYKPEITNNNNINNSNKVTDDEFKQKIYDEINRILGF